MIKVEVIKDFRYGEFGKIKGSLKRGTVKADEGALYVTDTFECDKKAADYLLGDNPIKEPVVKIVEVIPEEQPEEAKEEIPQEIRPASKPKKKKNKK